ncbi:hypothetical protein JMJ56_29780 [Belnapia sp. T18]|uniref:Uncharacterized protein n=1 Tax=Belnapia arida TaxID=2804533 RepID=A0ABS1UCA6_9PROT|nr:hypothetical protein [Belnapia arida]MBL6082170.1 hypothetical protein [Belnapia arida]
MPPPPDPHDITAAFQTSMAGGTLFGILGLRALAGVWDAIAHSRRTAGAAPDTRDTARDRIELLIRPAFRDIAALGIVLAVSPIAATLIEALVAGSALLQALIDPASPPAPADPVAGAAPWDQLNDRLVAIVGAAACLAAAGFLLSGVLGDLGVRLLPRLPPPRQMGCRR